MKLTDWLAREGVSYSEMARRIGTPHARTVERHAKLQRFPNREALRAYARETGGEVTADDFVEAEA